MTADSFAHHVKEAKPPTSNGGWWSALCPNHADMSPSLGFKDGEKGLVVKCHAGCSREQIAAAVGKKIADFFATKPKKVQMMKSLRVEALAKSKGFDPERLKSLGVEQCGDSVKMTYRMLDGSLAARHQLRHAGTPRFTWTKGAGAIEPYGSWILGIKMKMVNELNPPLPLGRSLFLVEGASDCWTAWSYGLPALGIPGADMARVLRLEHLEGIAHVFVVREPDQGGQAFVTGVAARLKEIGYAGEAFEIQIPSQWKDLNGTHLFLKKEAEKPRLSVEEGKRIDALMDSIPSEEWERWEDGGEPPSNLSDEDRERLERFFSGGQWLSVEQEKQLDEWVGGPERRAAGVTDNIGRPWNTETNDRDTFFSLLQALTDEAQPLAPPVDVPVPELEKTGDGMTSLDNAFRLVDAFGTQIAYVRELGWLDWQGPRWQRDPGELLLQRRAEAVVAAMQQDSFLMEWAEKCKNRAKLNEMVDLARTHVKKEPEDFDAHKLLFNFRNGTMDLEKQTLREHRKEDCITYISPVTFSQTAPTPRWMRFLDEVMCGRTELVAYLQRLVGYCLTGDVSEQCFFIFHGHGANGKSTFLEILRTLLGYDYARQTPAATFLQKKESSSGPSPEIARLKGCRLVTAVEIDKGRKLSESMVKQATGGDRAVGRYLYQDLLEYDPEYKIIIAANHKPRVQGTDHAIWRRINLVPFDATFKPGEGEDRELKKKLLAELPGIARWAAKGSALWLEHGLNPPDAVKVATETYRQEENRLREFFEDRVVFAPGARVTSADLFKCCQAWCAANGYEPISQKDIGGGLKEQSGVNATKDGDGVRGWKGIGLRNTAHTADTAREVQTANSTRVTKDRGAASDLPENKVTEPRAVSAVPAVPACPRHPVTPRPECPTCRAAAHPAEPSV